MIKSKKGSFFVKMKFYYKKFKNKKKIFLRKYWYFISKKCFLENIIFKFKKIFFGRFLEKTWFFKFCKKIFEVNKDRLWFAKLICGNQCACA